MATNETEVEMSALIEFANRTQFTMHHGSAWFKGIEIYGEGQDFHADYFFGGSEESDSVSASGATPDAAFAAFKVAYARKMESYQQFQALLETAV